MGYFLVGYFSNAGPTWTGHAALSILHPGVMALDGRARLCPTSHHTIGAGTDKAGQERVIPLLAVLALRVLMDAGVCRGDGEGGHQKACNPGKVGEGVS